MCKLAAVEVAAIDDAFFVIRHHSFIRTILRHHVRAAIADGEIEFAVRPNAQPVQIVAEKSDAHAKSIKQRFFGVRFAILVLIAKEPKIRNVRVINIPVMREDPGANAFRDATKTVGKDRGLVRLPIAIAVPQQPHPVAFLRIVTDPLAFVPLHDLDAFLDGSAGQFFIQPGHVLANVGDASVKAECFRDEETAFLVDGKRDGIGEQGLGREQLDFETLRNAKPFDGALAFI